ncbi:hypothetical protein Tco_0641824 [Tanacetum coccineum]
MWESPVDRPATFQYGVPQCACDIYPTNNGSFINGASQGYSENGSLPPASTTSIHWSNLIEAVTKSFDPLIGKEGLDDGVAASFQRSRIHKPHAHTQAFKVNHSTSR